MQALILALESIRLTLKSAHESFSWAGEDGDPGFPQIVPSFFGPEFSAHVGDLIESEVARFAQTLEARHADHQARKSQTGS
jgi:hypothetical protein